MKTYDGGTLSGTTITGTPVAEQDWGLDALGNWGKYTQKASGSATLNQTRSHNTANEINTIGIASGGTGTDWIDPTYDLAGNRVTGPYPLSPNLSLTMTYDAWNRLVRVQLNGTIQIFAAEYDGLGRRIVRTDEGMTRRSYYNESWQELEVRKEASAGVEDTDPMEQFVWHPYYIDALATRFYDANTSGTQTQHYFTHDANFNITSAINTSGAAVERYDYTPYGQPFILEPNFSADPDGTDIGNGYLYTGRYYDRAIGFFHYRHRTYDPAVGTFLTRDPIGYEGSEGNLYEYVEGRPVALLDPKGLWCTVFFKCELADSSLNGCTRNCSYLCKETGRKQGLFGDLLCNDVPADMVTTTFDTVTSYPCLLGCDFLPGPCPGPFETSRKYKASNDVFDCSNSACKAGCQSRQDLAELGCQGLGGAAEAACVAAAAAANVLCTGTCDSICKKP